MVHNTMLVYETHNEQGGTGRHSMRFNPSAPGVSTVTSWRAFSVQDARAESPASSEKQPQNDVGDGVHQRSTVKEIFHQTSGATTNGRLGGTRVCVAIHESRHERGKETKFSQNNKDIETLVVKQSTSSSANRAVGNDSRRDSASAITPEPRRLTPHKLTLLGIPHQLRNKIYENLDNVLEFSPSGPVSPALMRTCRQLRAEYKPLHDAWNMEDVVRVEAVVRNFQFEGLLKALRGLWPTTPGPLPEVALNITLELKNVTAQNINDLTVWTITCKHNVWMHKFKRSYSVVLLDGGRDSLGGSYTKGVGPAVAPQLWTASMDYGEICEAIIRANQV